MRRGFYLRHVGEEGAMEGGRSLVWPYPLRQAALLMLGYMSGTSFTRGTALQIVQQLPSMLISTILTVLVSLSMAVCLGRAANRDCRWSLAHLKILRC
ncbi:AbrB family transcriptional regulator [Aneurinibacillus aneurinilyticus]|uniref:AbrB family transcriptional regulator n=1 Tax=Aneurinibacillus aneurinilyticus TaxID=1391 RepID=UPI00366EAFAA